MPTGKNTSSVSNVTFLLQCFKDRVSRMMEFEEFFGLLSSMFLY